MLVKFSHLGLIACSYNSDSLRLGLFLLLLGGILGILFLLIDRLIFLLLSVFGLGRGRRIFHDGVIRRHLSFLRSTRHCKFKRPIQINVKNRNMFRMKTRSKNVQL
jgi:uncharacterized membrane protein YbaN (DUF454 family)